MSKRRQFFIPFIAAALVLAHAVRASGANAPALLTDKARMLLDYQSFMRGDRDGAVRFALTASKELQGTPLAELAVRIALFYDPGTLSSVDVGVAEARRVLGNETDLPPELRDILRRFIARSLAAAGRRDEAMQIHRRRGVAMSWLVAGPFTNRKAANFNSRELPEPGDIFTRDVIADPPDAGVFKQWAKNPPWRPVPENRSFPYVYPWRLTGRQADGAMLLFSAVDLAEADNKAAFHINADTSWRLFVDGALAAEVDKNNHEAPFEHMIPFPLNAGKHTVSLQLFPPQAGKKAEDVRIALRLESGSTFAWDRNLAKPEKIGQAASARREARRLKYLTDLQSAMGESPMVMTAYAVGCLEQGMQDEAAWWAETAARADARDVNLHFLAGMLISMNPLLPAERRRDGAVAWHQGVLSVKPDLVPSLLYLASVASDAGKARDAADYLRKAYAVNPTSLDVLMARGVWGSRFASGATARAAWDECAKAFPDSSAAQTAIASLPQEGFLDMDRRLAACRAAVAAGPYVAESSLRLAEALAASGNQQEAEYVLRDALDLFAGDVRVLKRIGEVYARLSLYREAIDIMRAAVRLTPDDPDLWRRLGDFHMEAKDQDAAVKMWNVSLQANPGQFQLSDMIDYLEGRSERFFSADSFDAIAMTAATDAGKYPGDVVRLLDRSVIRIAADGSFRRLTHEIDMAKNRRGGESLANIETRGELLAARIVFPNGNTLEPEPFPGREGLRLPVIVPGAAREIRSLESIPAGASGPPAITPWFFQDPNGQLPFLVSEYVVYAPRGFPLVTVVKNLGNNVDYEKTEEGGMDVYRWTATLNLPSREPDAVHVSERVPSVEIGVKTGWDDIVYHELRQLEGRLVPSMRMRRLLDTLYQATPGKNPEPEQLARNIYRYVLDNIDPAPAGGTASHIFTDRMGERSMLLLSLLRAAGLDAQPAAARPNQRFMHPPTWELPRRDIFTVPIVRLAIPGGKTYWLDVRYDSLPFGKITDDLSGATLLAFTPGGPLFEPLPSLPAEDSLLSEERLISLPGPGEPLAVSGRSTRRGVAGLSRGQSMIDADAEARKKMALRSLFAVFPDAVLDRFEVMRADDSDAGSQERYEITSRFPVEERPDGTRAAALCMQPLRVISAETRNTVFRRSACHIDAEHIAEDRNVFSLPADGEFVRLPEPAQIPSRFGVYQLRVVQQGQNRVEIIRNYHIPAQRVQPWEWQDFLAFLERVDLAEKQWLEYSCGKEKAGK